MRCENRPVPKEEIAWRSRGLSWTLPDGNACDCHPDGSGRGTDNTLPVENACDRDVDTSERRPEALDSDAEVG